jgi:hypothetical protein
LRPGALLVIDEFDVGALDEVAAQWWLEQGPTHSHAAADPGELVADLRRHLHRLADILEALEPWFEPGRVVRGPYLYRFDPGPATRPREERAIARGEIPATGARVVVRLRRAR